MEQINKLNIYSIKRLIFDYLCRERLIAIHHDLEYRIKASFKMHKIHRLSIVSYGETKIVVLKIFCSFNRRDVQNCTLTF